MRTIVTTNNGQLDVTTATTELLQDLYRRWALLEGELTDELPEAVRRSESQWEEEAEAGALRHAEIGETLDLLEADIDAVYAELERRQVRPDPGPGSMPEEVWLRRFATADQEAAYLELIPEECR